jgi:hypothetical protein
VKIPKKKETIKSFAISETACVGGKRLKNQAESSCSEAKNLTKGFKSLVLKNEEMGVQSLPRRSLQKT